MERAIQLASLSRPVGVTVIALSALPAHTNLLRFGRLSHRHCQDACPVPERHWCRHQPAGSFPLLADIPCYGSTNYRFLCATGNDTLSLSCTTSLSPALLTTPSLLLLTSYVAQRLRVFLKVDCKRLWLERILYCFIKKVISSDEQRMVA